MRMAFHLPHRIFVRFLDEPLEGEFDSSGVDDSLGGCSFHRFPAAVEDGFDECSLNDLLSTSKRSGMVSQKPLSCS